MRFPGASLDHYLTTEPSHLYDEDPEPNQDLCPHCSADIGEPHEKGCRYYQPDRPCYYCEADADEPHEVGCPYFIPEPDEQEQE